MSDSIGYGVDCKPPKPYPEFPLYSHRSHRWAKKVCGRTHFFGRWRDDPAFYKVDWQAAYEAYQHQIPHLLQRRTPPPIQSDALTVGNMVNGMLEAKEPEIATGELSRRTWIDYERTGAMLIREFGRYTTIDSLTPEDFAKLRAKLSKTLGLVALGNEIGRCMVFFNWARKAKKVAVDTGERFKKPKRKALRAAKQAKPKKLFTLDELRTLYHAAKPQMRTFILLALNGGLGNHDVGKLEPRHIVGGWIVFPRPKTSVERRFPLWKETKLALSKVKQHETGLPYVFVTKYGTSWHKDKDSPLSKEFRKLCIECDCHQQERGFYSLRHTFRTVADGTLDRTAVDFIMGHDDGSMGRGYTEDVENERLQRVVDYVRKWAAQMFRKPVKKRGGAK